MFKKGVSGVWVETDGWLNIGICNVQQIMTVNCASLDKVSP